MRPVRSKGQQGQAIIELALALSVLLILSLGMVDVARILHAYLTTTNASREGARVAALGYDDAEIFAAVQASVGSALEQKNLVVEIAPAEDERRRGEPVVVKVQVPVPVLFPVLGAFVEDPLPVFSRTTMRME